MLFMGVPSICFSWNSFYGRVKFVPDGDTIVLKSGKVVRYIGIDCPEINFGKGDPQLFSKEARDFNKRLTYGKKLKIITGKTKRDRYHRILAYVYLPDGRMVNSEILRKGLGFFYFHKDNKKKSKEFLDIQNQAISEHTGIWAFLEHSSKAVIGNKRSMRFHSLDCRYGKKIYFKNKIRFSYPLEAFKKGFSPARKCIPDIYRFSR